ncbi:hypothetical protein ACMA1I_14020 [Pontibacter sp. 13R65]|uniref:hypothetical protein n=1 Tax=Pontibacter sp. 13R65 TaxID=3127458 RepID=UPI00301CD7B3
MKHKEYVIIAVLPKEKLKENQQSHQHRWQLREDIFIRMYVLELKASEKQKVFSSVVSDPIFE